MSIVSTIGYHTLPLFTSTFLRRLFIHIFTRNLIQLSHKSISHMSTITFSMDSYYSTDIPSVSVTSTITTIFTLHKNSIGLLYPQLSEYITNVCYGLTNYADRYDISTGPLWLLYLYRHIPGYSMSAIILYGLSIIDSVQLTFIITP
jgi:hypothetical protein